MSKTISIFNNKGGVGKTSIIWNLAISIADNEKNVLLIDFDPQCNLSIATLGSMEFSRLLHPSKTHSFGQTLKAFALPYIQQNKIGDVYTFLPKKPSKAGAVHIASGDFWLNTFSDILNVGTDVISGSGLYRFILPDLITKAAEEKNGIQYDYVLIDLPPSFNTLVRSALYCSDYFLVPCTPDLFSSYCVGLIGEMLPIFIKDWEQGKERYLSTNPSDHMIESKGAPKFGGWIFNGFDTRSRDEVKYEVGADAKHHQKIIEAIVTELKPRLSAISSYDAVPAFVGDEAVAKIEDLNVMASDSIIQNVPIKYLGESRPTNVAKKRSWASNQVRLMDDIVKEYEALSSFILDNF